MKIAAQDLFTESEINSAVQRPVEILEAQRANGEFWGALGHLSAESLLRQNGTSFLAKWHLRAGAVQPKVKANLHKEEL